MQSEISQGLLDSGDVRFDANFYLSDSFKYRKVICKQNYKPLSDFCTKIYWPGRFKRKYVGGGIPFYTASKLFYVLIKDDKYISEVPQDINVKRNWILTARPAMTYYC